MALFLYAVFLIIKLIGYLAIIAFSLVTKIRVTLTPTLVLHTCYLRATLTPTLVLHTCYLRATLTPTLVLHTCYLRSLHDKVQPI